MIKIVKKILVFTLILVILFNSYVYHQQKNYAYADVLVLPGLTIKMLACLLAALGIYAASEIDYVRLYNVAVEMIEDVKYLGAFAKNLIVNRVVPNVKGYYEEIMEWMQSLNISETFRYITIGTTGTIPVQGVPVSVNDSEIRVEITGDSQVFQIGGTFLKAEQRSWVDYPCYDLFWKQEINIGWEGLGVIDSNVLVLKEIEYWDDFKVYDVYYYYEPSNRDLYAYCELVVPLIYEPVDYLPGEPIDVRLRKVKDIGLESTQIGVIVDGYYTGEYDTWQEYLDYLNDIDSVNYDWYERFLYEYDINYTDVITPDIGLENIPLDEVESYPAIPGVDSPIDIPLDPTAPIDIPGDIPIDIPDEIVLDEPIPEDTVVPGLKLITRILRYIANAIKIGILTPVNILKEIAVSLYNVVRDIPGQIAGELEGIWTGVTTKVGEIADYVISMPGNIINGITGVMDDVKLWFESLLVPTLEIDLEPLKVTTIKEKFPFSLPWDIQRIIEELVDVPEIPRWTVNILGNELVIDFAIFEPLAKIVRWAVVIMFVIGLIKLYSMILL